MARDCPISQLIAERQELMFRLACDQVRYCHRPLTLNLISKATGINYNTLRSYAGHSGATAEMPLSAQFKLIGVIPPELLSLLLPDGHVIVRAPEEMNHDDIAEACRDFTDAKDRAHHPESECGRDIGPTEHNVLRMKAAAIPTGAAA